MTLLITHPDAITLDAKCNTMGNRAERLTLDVVLSSMAALAPHTRRDVDHPLNKAAIANLKKQGWRFNKAGKVPHFAICYGNRRTVREDAYKALLLAVTGGRCAATAAHYRDNTIGHHEYYSQFTACRPAPLLYTDGQLIASLDAHFNDCPRLTNYSDGTLHRDTVQDAQAANAFRYASMHRSISASDACCIAKAAARRQVQGLIAAGATKRTTIYTGYPSLGLTIVEHYNGWHIQDSDGRAIAPADALSFPQVTPARIAEALFLPCNVRMLHRMTGGA